MSDLVATEVTYVGKNVRGEPQEVRFFIDMMPFREGRDAWVNLRYQIAQAGVVEGAKKFDVVKALAGSDLSDGAIKATPDVIAMVQEGLVNIVDALMRVEPAVLQDIQDRQFKYIRFQIPGQSIMTLHGMEDQAFRGMPVVRAEELMVRSITRNFQPSLTAALSAFSPLLQRVGIPSSPST